MIETLSLQEQVDLLKEENKKLENKLTKAEENFSSFKQDYHNLQNKVRNLLAWVNEHNKFHEQKNWNPPYTETYY